MQWGTERRPEVCFVCTPRMGRPVMEPGLERIGSTGLLKAFAEPSREIGGEVSETSVQHR